MPLGMVRSHLLLPGLYGSGAPNHRVNEAAEEP